MIRPLTWKETPIPRFHLREAYFELPLPPSVDEMYVPVPYKRASDGKLMARFIKSPALKQFQQDAGWLLLSQGIQHPDWERASVLGYEAWIYVKTRASDCSNRTKAWEDLVAQVLHFNDNRFSENHVYRLIDKANPRIEINLYILEMNVSSSPQRPSRPHGPRKEAAQRTVRNIDHDSTNH